MDAALPLPLGQHSYRGSTSILAAAMSHLEQADADNLLAMEKYRADAIPREFPHMGERLVLPLISADGTEQFELDLQRKGRIKLSKITFVERTKQSIVLARLDIDGPPHRNPGEQTEIPCPHLHIYKEGYDDRFAIAAPARFTDTSDLYLTCHQFMEFCNVTLLPIINPRLVI